MVEKISTFNSIDITNERTLVICDIDDTLLHYPKAHDACHEMVSDVFPELDRDHPKYKKEFYEMLSMYKAIKEPECTDLEGFLRLVIRVRALNGDIIFLTARSESSIEYTKKHFTQIGLDYDYYKVHYTNNKITKGKYIKENIDLVNYTDVIFIDDYDCYIQTVLDEFNFIKCYKFEAQG